MGEIEKDMTFKQKIQPLLLADTLVVIWNLDKKGLSHEDIGKEMGLTKYRIDDIVISLRNYVVNNKISIEKRASEYMKAKSIILGMDHPNATSQPSTQVPKYQETYIQTIDDHYSLLKDAIVDLFELRVEKEVEKRTKVIIEELTTKHGKEVFKFRQEYEQRIAELIDQAKILKDRLLKEEDKSLGNSLRQTKLHEDMERTAL